MSATTVIDDSPSPFAPQGLTDDERHRIESDIVSHRAGIADYDTEIACCGGGSWRSWCILQREDHRRELVVLWQRLGEG